MRIFLYPSKDGKMEKTVDGLVGSRCHRCWTIWGEVL